MWHGSTTDPGEFSANKLLGIWFHMSAIDIFIPNGVSSHQAETKQVNNISLCLFCNGSLTCCTILLYCVCIMYILVMYYVHCK